jgi:hypothetical protein
MIILSSFHGISQQSPVTNQVANLKRKNIFSDLFFGGCCGVDRKRLSSGADQPAVAKLTVIVQRLKFHLKAFY